MELWQQIDKDTTRLKVPGGWLVRNVAMVTIQKMCAPTGMILKPGQAGMGQVVNEHHVCCGLCFYPDKEHAWTLEEGKEETHGEEKKRAEGAQAQDG